MRIIQSSSVKLDGIRIYNRVNHNNDGFHFISAEHVHTELGELVAGIKPARQSPDQITLYKSVGVAVQDAAAAALVIATAREQSAGLDVEL